MRRRKREGEIGERQQGSGVRGMEGGTEGVGGCAGS